MYQKVDYEERRCKRCGNTFKPKTKRSMYCSKSCHKADHRHEWLSTQQWRQAHKWIRPKRGPFKCKCCGKEFYTRRPKGEGETYCSRECSFKHKAATVPTGTAYSCPIYFGTCVNCGTSFSARRKRNTCCNKCSKEHASRFARQAAEAERKENGSAITCSECGTLFTRLYGNKARVCSEECADSAERRANRIYKAKRRKHIEWGDNIDPLEVFERDGWTCKACGCDTPKELRGTTHDDAPELDHVVALAVGGTHTWDNVQTLCRTCNILKSTKAHEEFIREIKGMAGGFRSCPSSR